MILTLEDKDITIKILIPLSQSTLQCGLIHCHLFFLRFKHLNIIILYLFRISTFVFRIFYGFAVFYHSNRQRTTYSGPSGFISTQLNAVNISTISQMYLFPAIPGGRDLHNKTGSYDSMAEDDTIRYPSKPCSRSRP